MYTFLTGATGFLGRYLMRDLLLRGCNLAVLVRPGRGESALQRVDTALSYWEHAWKRALPRPVVLTGDITRDGLGLSQFDQRWLAKNCRAVLHSAASLTFYEEDGEPWQTNVQGVRHVLELCEQLAIRTLFHVSTAYTCGLRNGIVYEHELDLGQEYGNDYERSKVQAEQLIRHATCLDVATILRPSIIVGDSLTGFSSTFHGFYTPLRLVCALMTQVSHEQVFSADYLALMGLVGDEGKNFVPVDWVSQAIVSIMERRPASSQTYALASMAPVSTDRMMNVIRVVTKRHVRKHASTSAVTLPSLDASPSDPILAAYLEQLRTYRSYWRNDPVFDCSNTTNTLPDLPCPILTDETLVRLADWAINHKFSVPRTGVDGPTVVGPLRVDRSESSGNNSLSGACVLTITGPGGGTWTIGSSDTDSMCVREGRTEGAPELCISNEVFSRIIGQQTTLYEAAQAGDLVTIGPSRDLDSWRPLLASALRQSIISLEQ